MISFPDRTDASVHEHDSDTTWHYVGIRPFVCLSLAVGMGCMVHSTYAVTWPIAAAPVVTSSFGDDEGRDIHAGIDIPGAAGTAVRAVVASTVNKIWWTNGGGGSSIVIGAGAGMDVYLARADDAAGNEHYYMHVRPPAAGNILVGQALVEGANFARIRGAAMPFGGTFDHLHYCYAAHPNIGLGNEIDPLRYVFPYQVPNETVSEAIDGRSLTYLPIGVAFPIYGHTPTARVIGRFVKLGLDMIAEIINNMGDQQFVQADIADPRGTTVTLFLGITAVPYKISYEIEKPPGFPRGDVPQRTLVEFNNTNNTHDPQEPTIYDRQREVTKDLSNTYNYNFFITNTNGTIPTAANFWKTNAEKNGNAAVGDGSARGNAANNADCAFPDGVYEVIPWGHPTDDRKGTASVYDVLVNNWKQNAKAARAAGEAPGAGGTSDEANPGTESEDSPPPVVQFVLGDDLYVKGTEYLEDTSYTAYVFPYTATWNQEDPLTGSIANAAVTSDANGDISGQLLWGDIDQVGDFNIVIDYDGDGVFSWTLDGLGAFRVVEIIPTVSEWGLIVMTVLGLTGGTIVFARRRRSAKAA